ncbi:MAG: HPr(Ser) kinase/phosphatase [Proteobacteria bacterium]|nr:HPr(Ser) kinase/phosphatase [Pseudomonadota bacterium]
MKPPAPVTILQLLAEAEDELDLTIRVGRDGLDREIAIPRIEKPGLALTGYTGQLHENRLLVLGATEIDYLASVGPTARALGVTTVMASHPACIVITRGLEPPKALVESCEDETVPLLSSRLSSTEFIGRVTSFLSRRLAPRTKVHGVMLDVLGIGILIMGKSGIGKSEIALDLISRGHRLVADDVVEIRWSSPNVVYGAGAGIVRHHMEIRGLGIINIKQLFGVSAIRETKKIELVIELVEWDDSVQYDRLGLDEEFYEVIDVAIARLQLPVRPGRAMATIIEVAARNQLLKMQGYHAAREFQKRIDQAIAAASPHRYDIDRVE